jgi:L-alanine-DL-glutamate epimerase-like enolase superfamily enzyme
MFVLPERPGLGVELNEEVAREHLKPGHRFFGD